MDIKWMRVRRRINKPKDLSISKQKHCFADLISVREPEIPFNGEFVKEDM